jgi:C1A family cysteine protease
MFYSLFLTSLLCVFANAVNYDFLFRAWVSEYRMTFQNDIHRQSVFVKWVDNHIFIEKNNAANKTYVLGHNQFSGMDLDEFRRWLGFSEVRSEPKQYATDALAETQVSLDSVDWVAKGAVSAVKDQGQCGSCWSFSTTGALEGAYAIKYGTLAVFSEQQLVDCDTLGNGGRDHGCNGGLMDNAFSWIKKNNGLCSEQDYPYISSTTKSAGSCEKTCSNVKGSAILKYVDVEPNSDSAFIAALSGRPVSVAIEADQREFQLYKSGVFTGTCGTNLDHGVLVVGYGTDNGQAYYKIKNSWSSTWGEGGYIRIGRGDQYNHGSGQCGVLMEASYPVL